MSLLIQLESIGKVFSTDELETHALRDVHLSIRRGEYLAIEGPSGSGKTTLLSILGLLDVPSTGRHLLGDREVSTLDARERARLRNREIGFVFQTFNLIGDLTVAENVELPLRYAGIAAGERQRRVEAALDRVQMSHRKGHMPSQLSGGQQQARPGDEGPGDGDPLALAAREFRGPVAHALLEPHLLQGRAGALGPLPAIDAGVDERQLDIVDGVRPGQQVEGLEHEADLPVAERGQFGVTQRGNGSTVEQVVAPVRAVEAADDVHEGRLARPGRPHDGHVLAAANRHIHPLEGADHGVAHREAAGQRTGDDHAIGSGARQGRDCCHKPVWTARDAFRFGGPGQGPGVR